MSTSNSMYCTPRGGDVKAGQIYWMPRGAHCCFPDSHMCVILNISNSKKYATVVPITSSNKAPNVLLGTLNLPDRQNATKLSYASIENIITLPVDQLKRYSINIESSARAYIDPELSVEQHSQLLEWIVRRIVVLKQGPKQTLFERLAEKYIPYFEKK